MSSVRALAGLLAALCVAGCGVPQSSTVKRVDQPLVLGDATVPPATTNTTTTTTTTTTTVVTTRVSTTSPTTAPPATTPPTTSQSTVQSTVPSTVPSTSQPTPTTLVVQGVDLYYIIGLRLTHITKKLASPVSPQTVLDALQQSPQLDSSPSLRSAIPANSNLRVTVKGGVATVEVAANFQSISGFDAQLAVAQIVLSLKLPGIGQVTFLSNGQGFPLNRGDNSIAPPGALLTIDEFEPLVINQ